MDFDFSDDQEQLRDAVRKWVDKGYDFDRRRAIVAAGGFDRAAYHTMRTVERHSRRHATERASCGGQAAQRYA